MKTRDEELRKETGGCFVIVVGKKASATGDVCIGHNEDNTGPLCMPHYYVPEGQHVMGELISFEEGAARIPQVEKTFGYFWTETLRPWPGESFGDSFVNEKGVCIVSNSCCRSREDDPEITDGGIGYGLRRLIAERARSARDAVAVAVELVDRYGYLGSGRSYVFADADEAWVFQVVNGKNYAAQRVPDREVAVNANHYTIRHIDFEDTDNFLVSPNLVSRAIKKKWYKPATKGDYSDFDFAASYQHRDYYRVPLNVPRHTHALLIAAGRSVADGEELPFSVKPKTKVTVAMLKEALSSHCMPAATKSKKTKKNLASSPHAMTNGIGSTGNDPEQYTTICNAATKESLVIQLRKDPDFTTIWSAQGNPCTNAYVPWYLGAKAMPAMFNKKEPAFAQLTHFQASAFDLSYDKRQVWSVSQDIQNLCELCYAEVFSFVADSKKMTEDLMFHEQEALELKLAKKTRRSSVSRRGQLFAHSSRLLSRFLRQLRDIFQQLAPDRVQVLNSEIDLYGEPSKISVVITSDEHFDPSKIKKETLCLGISLAERSLWSQAESFVQKEEGAWLATFEVHPWRNEGQIGAMPLWVTAEMEDGTHFAARDIVLFVSSEK